MTKQNVWNLREKKITKMPSRINPTLVLFIKENLIKFQNIGLNEIILRVGLILL